MFSLPINQKLNEQQFYQLLDFVSAHKDYIYDVYFTCRMPPFTQDAMGDVISADNVSEPINAALHLQQVTGVKVSATFNNINVPPTQKNLDLFIQNFQQLYDAGVRSATIPHTHWVSTGQIQKAFPELLIKNTILRNAYRANEIAKYAEAGFHYVNLDRDIMRDRDELIKCRKAADKYGVKLSLLANEGCLGNCPMMDEHFQFNNSRSDGPSYFMDSISRVSCPKWDVLDPSTSLKTANIPPWREDWEEMLQYVDVFKMHGRESINQLHNTMNIISKYANNEEVLFGDFDDYINDVNLAGKPIQAWRQFIKNCKFDCWDCNKCDKLYAAKKGPSANKLVEAVANELVDSVSYKNNISVPGLTSKRVQNLLHGLASHVSTYLEIGSAVGSTLLSIPDIKIHAIDNWKSDIQPENNSFFMPKNEKAQFIENTKHFSDLTVHDCDLFEADRSKINDVEMMFYDGPHDAESTKLAVEYYSKCLADTAILVFDDANWAGVVEGARAGINTAKLNVLYEKVITNDVEDASMWWNGVYIVVVSK